MHKRSSPPDCGGFDSAVFGSVVFGSENLDCANKDIVRQQKIRTHKIRFMHAPQIFSSVSGSNLPRQSRRSEGQTARGGGAERPRFATPLPGFPGRVTVRKHPVPSLRDW